MDAVTAISGSGPAYIFFVVESMIEAGVHLGLPRATATDLVVQTLVGSAAMLRETGTHPVVLREQVTSPGGTTASALRELEVHRVRAAFLAAMEAARNRSREHWPRAAEPLEGGSNVRHMECAGPASVVFDQTLTEYNFGPTHPMSPVRVDLTMRLADELGVLDGIKRVDAPVADRRADRDRARPGPHRRGHPAGATPGFEDAARGLGTEDDPVFADMHVASAHVVGATLEAFRQVWSGESLHSVNIAGGLHHAMPDKASGFCIYNDVAVGHQAAARRGGRAGRLRRHRRPPRRRRGEGLLGRPAGPHDLPARDRADALPRHRLPERHRRPRRRGHGGQRRAAARHRRRAAGCARSTPSYPRSCASSPRRCWSPSTAATPT